MSRSISKSAVKVLGNCIDSLNLRKEGEGEYETVVRGCKDYRVICEMDRL